jgi:hypothetical protein
VSVEPLQAFARDADVSQEMPGASRVLGDDAVAVSQGFDGAHRDVAEIAYRRGHDEERTGY